MSAKRKSIDGYCLKGNATCPGIWPAWLDTTWDAKTKIRRKAEEVFRLKWRQIYRQGYRVVPVHFTEVKKKKAAGG